VLDRIAYTIKTPPFEMKEGIIKTRKAKVIQMKN
jgi:hypothetical protein